MLSSMMMTNQLESGVGRDKGQASVYKGLFLGNLAKYHPNSRGTD